MLLAWGAARASSTPLPAPAAAAATSRHTTAQHAPQRTKSDTQAGIPQHKVQASQQQQQQCHATCTAHSQATNVSGNAHSQATQ